MMKELFHKIFTSETKRYPDELIAKMRLEQKREDLMLSMLSLFPKLVLTGSTLLSTTGILKRNPGDLDFSVKELLTETEIKTLMDFFKLKHRFTVVDRYSEDMDNKTDSSPNIICLLKVFEDDDDLPFESRTEHLKIDIFCKEILSSRDIVIMDYFGRKLEVSHPSIPLSYKMRYVLNPRIKNNDRVKHREDMQNISIYYENIVRDLKTLRDIEMDRCEF